MTDRHSFVYARYHRSTAIVAPFEKNGKPLQPAQARRLVKRLRERYPLAGLKIWEQSEFNPTATASWEALREIIVNTIARRAGQNENGTEIVPPSQNVSHPVI